MSQHRNAFYQDGQEWLSRAQALIEQGRLKRLILRQVGGQTLIDVPLVLGLAVLVILLAALPTLLALLALIALFGRCHLTIEPEPTQ